MIGKALLFICFGAASIPIQASILLSEDFSYPDGSLISVSEEKWKSHSGTEGQARVGGGQLLLTQRMSEDVSAGLDGGPLTASNTSAIYTRFTVTFSTLPAGAQGGYFAHFKNASAAAGYRCRIFATTNGAAGGCFKLGVASGANTATAFLPHDLLLYEPYVVVFRMVLSDDVCTLWLDPKSETDSGVISTDSPTPQAVAAFAFRESLASGSGIGEMTVDNLIVATTFAEAVPEQMAPPVVSISFQGGAIELRWQSEIGHSYSVWATNDIGLGLALLSNELWFWDGIGTFYETPSTSTRFYKISSP